MPATFLSSVKGFLMFVLHLILTVMFAFLTWIFWGLYHQEKLSYEFQQQGKPVTITVNGYNDAKKNWTDYLGNIKYISFTYKGKTYNTRYTQDSVFVTEGTKLTLLYNPSSDAFRQPSKEIYSSKNNESLLIGWTGVALLSPLHKSLLSFLLVALAFFFLLAGLLARIPGLYVITSVAGFVFSVLLLAGVVYVSYDAFNYYRYYHHIKNTGEKQQVTVLDKDVYYLYNDNGNNGNFDPFRYVYTATVDFKNNDRTIPVSLHDYNSLQKGSRLNVYYDTTLNDMMAADYSINPSIFIFSALLWLITIIILSKRFRRKKT